MPYKVNRHLFAARYEDHVLHVSVCAIKFLIIEALLKDCLASKRHTFHRPCSVAATAAYSDLIMSCLCLKGRRLILRHALCKGSVLVRGRHFTAIEDLATLYRVWPHPSIVL